MRTRISLTVFLLCASLLGGAVAWAQPPQRQDLPPDYEERVAKLEQSRRLNPADLPVLEALVDSYAMGGRYEHAIFVLQEMLAQKGDQPAWRLRLAKFYSWAGQPAEALQTLRELNRPDDPEAVELECQTLASAQEAARAASCYQRLLELVKDDAAKTTEVQLSLARNQLWAGKSGPGIRNYRIYLEANPTDRTSTMELIRQLRYRGQYGRAEKLCDQLLQFNPEDAEVLALKSEVLHWSRDRSFSARQAAEQAVALAPDSPDAKVGQLYALRDLGERRAAIREFQVLQRQVGEQGGPTSESTFGDAYRLLAEDLADPVQLEESVPYSVYNDSDSIRNVFAGVQLAMPLRDDHKLRLHLSRQRSSAPEGSLFTAGRDSASLNEFSFGGDFRVRPGLHLTTMAGGSMRSAGDGARPTFEVGLAGTPADRWSFDFSVGREFLGITPRAIDLETSSYRVGGGVRYAFDSRTSLAFRADRRYWSDDNRSVVSEGTFRRILHYYKPFMVDGGVRSRLETHEEDTRFASGFFTPDQLWRHEGFVGVHGELGRRVMYELRGALGTQRMVRDADYRRSWEVFSTVSVRLAGQLRLSGNYVRRNYSLLSREGWYQGFYFSLGLQH